jgi:hypothetical protein
MAIGVPTVAALGSRVIAPSRRAHEPSTIDTAKVIMSAWTDGDGGPIQRLIFRTSIDGFE